VGRGRNASREAAEVKRGISAERNIETEPEASATISGGIALNGWHEPGAAVRYA
jgi:hypothetical protein